MKKDLFNDVSWMSQEMKELLDKRDKLWEEVKTRIDSLQVKSSYTNEVKEEAESILKIFNKVNEMTEKLRQYAMQSVLDKIK